MPDSPGDQNAFPLRELEVPLHRAAEVKSRHSLWVADPSSPDGGQGPGYHVHFSWRRAREEAWQSFQNAIPVWGLYRNRHRYHNVLYALNSSTAQAGGLMLEESGASLDKILTGLLPSLVDLAKWVGLGALLGGGVGALGGPFDEVTVPAGAVAGAEIGLFIANSLGLASLLVGVMENLGSFVQYAGAATEIAWYAGDDPHVPEASDLSSAEKLFAFALAELWMALLQALIAEVLRRVGKNLGDKIAKSEAINAVAKKIGESKLGSATAEWFQKNFDKLNEAVEKRKAARLKLKGQEGDGGGSSKPADTVKAEKTAKVAGGAPKNTGAKFTDDAKLQSHFEDHGGDFGARTEAEYQQQASDFLTRIKPQGVLEKIRPNGDIVRYNPATEEFGVLSKSGAVRTYYKPDPAIHGYPTNLDYFNAQ